jgi:hypothetical protein
MYNDAAEWATQDTDTKLGLFEFVKGVAWHDLEKTWFLQQYYGYGYPLPNSLRGKTLTRDDFDTNGGGLNNGGGSGGDSGSRTDCMCRPLRLTFEQSLRPWADGTKTQQKDGVYQNTWGTPPSESFSRAGKRWVAWGMKGPAKYMQAWQETPRCTRGRTYENVMSTEESELSGAGDNFTDATGGNQSMVKMIWACVGFEDLIPEECLCERDPRIRVCYTYSGESMASAETLSGGICRGGRDAMAYSEDLSFIAYNSNFENDSGLEVIQSGRLRAGVSCSYSADWSSFIADVLLAGVYASKALVKTKTIIGAGSAIFYGFKMADAIKNAAKGPIESFTGSCGVRRAQSPAVLDGCFTRTLTQNQEAVVLLQSNGKVLVRGKGRHKGTARVLSSFGLSVTMQRSDPDQIGPICCRTGNGVYSLAHTPGNPFASLGGLQTWARNNFFADGIDQVDNISNMNGEYGYRDGGGLNEACQLQIANVTPHSRGASVAGLFSTAQLNIAGQVITVENNTDLQHILTITDMNGQPLAQKTIAPMMDNSYDLSSWDVPQGVYIYQLSNGQHLQSGKIFKY